MSFASAPRMLVLSLFLMAFALQDDATPDVEIKLTNGLTFQAKLIKFQDGVYTVRVNETTREIHAREISSISHQNEQDLPEKDAEREPPRKEDRKLPEENEEEKERLGYLVTISSDPSAKGGVGSWRKTCDQALKRLEAFGIDKTMVTRAASTMEIRLGKVEEKFAENVVRLLTFKGEIVAYVETTLTELEKEKYREPDAPKGKKWLTRFENEEVAVQHLPPLKHPSLPPVLPADSQPVIVIDKPIPLRNFIDSIDVGKEPGGGAPGVASGLTIAFNMNGLRAFASLKGNDLKTQVYICIDDRYLGTASPTMPRLSPPVSKTQATIIGMSYKFPITEKIDVTISPIRSDSDKFPAVKQQ
ncbi:MAG: hypothetical protein A2Z34_00560 [Planctomycetes bacterium RBG_16_59_8]|nr:MAG: hypothetical protein A2Z34_00560 [Planctomycetes bacterium RBG_16_59_8]